MLKRRREPEREPFDLFVLKRTCDDPSLNLEDALNQYIKKYRLAICDSLDEPGVITDARTKLRILDERFSEDDPEEGSSPDEKLENYLKTLRATVRMYDSLPPEVLKRMKEKEKQ